jgi:hypothetical protein
MENKKSGSRMVAFACVVAFAWSVLKGFANSPTPGLKSQFERTPDENLSDAQQHQAESDGGLTQANIVNKDNQPKSTQRTPESTDCGDDSQHVAPMAPAIQMQQPDPMTHYTRKIARSTFGVVVVTALYALFAGGQWWEIRKNSSQTQQMIDVNKRIADISEQSLILSTRPYVNVEASLVTLQPNNSATIALRFTNDGNSPTELYAIKTRITLEPTVMAQHGGMKVPDRYAIDFPYLHLLFAQTVTIPAHKEKLVEVHSGQPLYGSVLNAIIQKGVELTINIEGFYSGGGGDKPIKTCLYYIPPPDSTDLVAGEFRDCTLHPRPPDN